MDVSQTAATTGSQSLLEQNQVVSPVTQPKTARSVLLAASTIAPLDLQMTELREKSGQTSLATVREETTARSARAGQTVLPTEIETNHAVLIQEASVIRPPAQIVLGSQELLHLVQTALCVRTLTALGNHVLQDQTDQSARQIQEALLLVQTHASMTGIEILTARTESPETVQGMRASWALAIRTQTRRLSSRTGF